MRLAQATNTAGYSSGVLSVMWLAAVLAARSTAWPSAAVKPYCARSLLSFIVSIEVMNLKPARPVGSDTSPATTGVASDVASVAPLELLAVSCARSVWPTSLARGTSVWLAAPEISVQLAPAALHRCHGYESLVGLPVQ